MDDSRAKWREACDIYSALDYPMRSCVSQLFGDLAATRSRQPGHHQSAGKDADDLNRAIKMCLDKQNMEAAKAHQTDIVKDYEDAIAGADIMATLEGKK